MKHFEIIIKLWIILFECLVKGINTIKSVGGNLLIRKAIESSMRNRINFNQRTFKIDRANISRLIHRFGTDGCDFRAIFNFFNPMSFEKYCFNKNLLLFIIK